jgi:hypothetical protein
MNRRWKVFRGDSTSRRDLLFTVVKPSVIPLRWSTKVNVFLASNDAEQACDFRITGSYHDGACSVSLGDSDTVIAKARSEQQLVYPQSLHYSTVVLGSVELTASWSDSPPAADRSAVHRGELAAGEEHLQRHRQPRHRLRLRRRARRRPGRDALPMISATAASGRLNESLCIRPSHVVLFFV